MKKTLRTVLLLAVFSGVLLAGCEAVGIGDDDSGDRDVAFVNATDRPIVIIAFERESASRVDPLPALKKEAFERRKIALGATGGPKEIADYERGDGIAVFVYASGQDSADELIAERWGADAAPMVDMLKLSADELDDQDYRVEIKTLGGID